MGFEQLAALKAQLTKEAKLKKQQEQATEKPAVKKVPKPEAKPDRPARPARPARTGANARASEKAPPVDPVVRVIGKLQKRFPAAFPKNPAPKVPLKVGILADLIAQASQLQLSEAEIREAVSTWCRGSRYWACLTDGAARVDLTGAPAGEVTARDAAFARNQAKGGAGARRRARSKPGAATADAGAAIAAVAGAGEGAEAGAEAAQVSDAPPNEARPNEVQAHEAQAESVESGGARDDRDSLES